MTQHALRNAPRQLAICQLCHSANSWSKCTAHRMQRRYILHHSAFFDVSIVPREKFHVSSHDV
ncbi:hypothetical protein N7449_004950, partial [Penicillium cf. viridicatum]